MADGMEDIIQDFVTEAEEALEKVDPLFVELEEKGYDREILNDIFRSVHTIKGAAGFLGFQGIIDVAHKTEALMKKLRDGDMQITSSLISLILRSVDMLKSLLGHIKEQDGKEEDMAPLLEELERARGEGDEEEPVPPVEAAPQDVKSGGKAEEPLPESPPPSARETGKEEEQGREAPQAAKAAREKEESPAAQSPRKELVRTLRVDVDRIDKVMNLTGEIVLVRNRLLNLGNFLEAKFSSDIHVEGLQETVAFLDLVTSDIQLAVMKMRMQPGDIRYPARGDEDAHAAHKEGLREVSAPGAGHLAESGQGGAAEHLGRGDRG
jgi:two-component system chemotaxis sensor kinase CheA